VTKEFCDWVRELGGDPSESHANNIEESTIFSLFASGYETKPALSVPIHVVQLSGDCYIMCSFAKLLSFVNVGYFNGKL